MTITEAPPTRTSMQVRKRNGDTEPVDVGKIVRAVDRVSGDLADVDPMRVATRTIAGLYDGASTAELDRLSQAGQSQAGSRGDGSSFQPVFRRFTVPALVNAECVRPCRVGVTQSTELGTLYLPDEVLKKVYQENATRVLKM